MGWTVVALLIGLGTYLNELALADAEAAGEELASPPIGLLAALIGAFGVWLMMRGVTRYYRRIDPHVSRESVWLHAGRRLLWVGGITGALMALVLAQFDEDGEPVTSADLRPVALAAFASLVFFALAMAWSRSVKTADDDPTTGSVVWMALRRLAWGAALVMFLAMLFVLGIDDDGTIPADVDASRALRLGAIAAGLAFVAALLSAPGAAPQRPPLTFATVRSPRGLSRLLFLPEDRYDLTGNWIHRAASLRSVLGLAGVTLSAALPAFVDDDIGRTLEQFAVAMLTPVGAAFQTMIVGGGFAVIVSAVAVARVGAENRSLAVAGLVRVVRTVVVTLAVIGLFFLLAFLTTPVFEWFDAQPAPAEFGDGPVTPSDAAEAGRSTLLAVVGIAFVVPMFWALAFFFYSAFYVAKYFYRIGEGHPALVPLVAIASVWTLWVAGLFVTLTFDVTGGRAAWAPGLLGAITTTGLALAERHLLARQGHTVTSGWR
ncbi:MAG: hypothetical protein AAF467_10260 [Actinomycetota bacterium]